MIQMGGFPAVKTGAPSPYEDLYYWVMEMSWPWFIALVSVSFVAINLVFETLYALLPGAIGTMVPGSVIEVAPACGRDRTDELARAGACR